MNVHKIAIGYKKSSNQQLKTGVFYIRWICKKYA